MTTNLYDEGGLASYIGRPLGVVSVPPSYNITFFNKTMKNNLTKLNFVSESSLTEYTEDLSISTKYTRILHFNIVDRVTGKPVDQSYYVPFIDSIVIENGKSVINVKPLVEIIDPTFIQNENSETVMYFFSNFNYGGATGSSVSAIYHDDPDFLRRTVEFATNNANSIYLGSSSSSSNSVPQYNNRNLYVDGYPEDDEPKLGFLSCFLRVGEVTIDGEAKMFVFAEKPRFITFVGERFNLDFHPPMLVNGIQKLEWAEDKAASDDLDTDAVNDDPQRQVPYHHLISGIKTVMSPGYTGINFETKPINDLYDKSLDHIFQVNDVVRKSFDINIYTNLRRISVRQEDLESVSFPEFVCSEGICAGSSSSAILSGNYRIFTTDTTIHTYASCQGGGTYRWSWYYGNSLQLNDVGGNCYTRYGSDCSVYFPSLSVWYSLAYLFGGPNNWQIKAIRGYHLSGVEDPCLAAVYTANKDVQTFSPGGSYGSDWNIIDDGPDGITSSSYDLNRHFVVFDVRTGIGDSWRNYRLISYDNTPFPLRTSDSWAEFFGSPVSMFDIGGDCFSVEEAISISSYNNENNAIIGTCPPAGITNKQWLNFCICGGSNHWQLEVTFYTYSSGWKIIKSESIDKTNQTESPNGCYGNLWYVLDKGESTPIGGNPCSLIPSSSSSEISIYNVEVPADVNLWGKDKPEFWKKYWSECGPNPGTPAGGTIEINKISETLFEGTACIDGIDMYATLKADPIWNYDSINRRKWNLEVGLMAAVGGQFDVVWTGNKTEDISIEGTYDREYALGDNTPSTIEIVIP